MSKSTYIKLDRGITNNWLWADKPFSKGQAWIDLLLMANYKDHKRLYQGQLQEYKKGEVNTSVLYLATRWGWTRKKVAAFLTILESDKMVTIKGTTKGTTVTIENYTLYQSEYTTQGTTQYTTQGTTGVQQRDNQGTHTIKNNNIKKRLYNDTLTHVRAQAQTEREKNLERIRENIKRGGTKHG